MVLLVRFASGLWTAYKVGTRAGGFAAMTLRDPYQKYHRPQGYYAGYPLFSAAVAIVDSPRSTFPYHLWAADFRCAYAALSCSTASLRFPRESLRLRISDAYE